MTRLTTIGQVPPAQRPDARPQPSRDFAEALAKGHGGRDSARAAMAPSSPPEQPAWQRAVQGPAVPGQVVPGQRALGQVTPGQVVPGQGQPAGVAQPVLAGPAVAAADVPAVVGHPALDLPGVHDPARLPGDGLVLPGERELQVAEVHPVGVTEALQSARVFGVHLLAGSYLSEILLRDESVGRPIPAAEPAYAGGEAQPAVPAPHGGAAPPSLADVIGGQPSFPQMAVAPSETFAGVESRHAVETVSCPAGALACGAPAEVAWSERILRITGEREGHAVAWLRDFRLDAAGEARLVQSVRQEARAHGVKLAKIMVNGREAWASREANRL